MCHCAGLAVRVEQEARDPREMGQHQQGEEHGGERHHGAARRNVSTLLWRAEVLATARLISFHLRGLTEARDVLLLNRFCASSNRGSPRSVRPSDHTSHYLTVPANGKRPFVTGILLRHASRHVIRHRALCCTPSAARGRASPFSAELRYPPARSLRGFLTAPVAPRAPARCAGVGVCFMPLPADVIANYLADSSKMAQSPARCTFPPLPSHFSRSPRLLQLHLRLCA